MNECPDCGREWKSGESPTHYLGCSWAGYALTVDSEKVTMTAATPKRRGRPPRKGTGDE